VVFLFFLQSFLFLARDLVCLWVVLLALLLCLFPFLPTDGRRGMVCMDGKVINGLDGPAKRCILWALGNMFQGGGSQQMDGNKISESIVARSQVTFVFATDTGISTRTTANCQLPTANCQLPTANATLRGRLKHLLDLLQQYRCYAADISLL
jgi:hypothetical protein